VENVLTSNEEGLGSTLRPMQSETEGDSTLWIQPGDKPAKAIDADLVASGQRNWQRVAGYAKRVGQDAARAAEELEAAVRYLAALIHRHPRFRERIKNLDDYVFWAAAHRLNRRAAKEPPIEYVGSVGKLNALRGAKDSNWVSGIEDEVFLREVTGCMSERTRYLFSLRQMGWSWEDIAKNLGITANAAQVQFNRGVARARKRILGRTPPKSDPAPEQGRAK
jgi:DNA-directed RNA polymerase specialized sigma24 family protein